ncbi:hypothetical protein JTB14_037958 [Gonioctena quinquepunctata]|nr:hypothetical protein JTB14_037958 [Gonioctena quinquepunctata]
MATLGQYNKSLICKHIFLFQEVPNSTEALEIAYADDLDVEEVFIKPPEANILTDEESGDNENKCDTNRLPGRQLSARAEIVLSNSERIGDENDDDKGMDMEDDADRVGGTKSDPRTLPIPIILYLLTKIIPGFRVILNQ